MPEKPRIIFEAKECPICHHPETVTQKATKDLREAGKIPKEAFTSAERLVVPLGDPRVALTIETLIMYHDTCAKCGIRYCTRAEVVTGMVQMVRRQTGPPQTPFSTS